MRDREDPEADDNEVAADPETSAHRDRADPERLARRADELYERRGGEHGRHEADWLEAERELLDAPTEGTDE
jgi:hypothetical protein